MTNSKCVIHCLGSHFILLHEQQEVSGIALYVKQYTNLRLYLMAKSLES